MRKGMFIDSPNVSHLSKTVTLKNELLAQLKQDSSGGDGSALYMQYCFRLLMEFCIHVPAIVLHGISASKHVATINSHSVCICFGRFKRNKANRKVSIHMRSPSARTC
uniref:Uncharacterized protein n=1 Tax=Oryza punctata TaxID=4537 RepID=A0A0E0LZ61_ORYPU